MQSEAEAVTLALHGRWYGHYGLAFCPAHDNHRTPALTLRDGESGRLLAHCKAGCAFEDVIGTLAGIGLIDGREDREPDPIAAARAREREREAAATRRRQALAVWKEGMPAAGTLVEHYLRARGIDRDQLPPALRFHERCWHPMALRLPAMVALVRREGEAEPVAVHRTWLAEPGRKAKVEPAKAMLGPCAGGAVRLSGGEGALVVAEGIETALSLPRSALGAFPCVWAALSTSGMKALSLPVEPGRLVVAPDNDDPGRAAADALAERASRLGWEVYHLRPPAGRGDWNDILREGAAA